MIVEEGGYRKALFAFVSGDGSYNDLIERIAILLPFVRFVLWAVKPKVCKRKISVQQLTVETF